MTEKKTIIVDIDGTLTEETEGYGTAVYLARTPKKKMIQKVKNLYAAGHNIVLWTSRYVIDEPVTILWLKRWRVPYHELHLGKPQYCVWIDDKAVHPNDFNAAKYL